ncbi:MAG TPA: purine-nucleoside phosphorylase [Pyrinomonadaceae bacterium]|nr:purine-nucleoside phosphorylase [Pyrinomonadaceae bacterium]
MTHENALEAAEYIRSKYDGEPKIAVVLGSGLGSFADELENSVAVPYEEIPHFVRSTVEGHAGRLVLGEVGDKTVVVQQGRFHYYEGYTMEQVMFPVRTFGRMGIETVLLTNAAGSLNADMRPGSLMLISDHINMMGRNPLRGQNDERFGPRFPDMTTVYDRTLQRLIDATAGDIAAERFEQGIDSKLTDFLYRGVYCALSGPTYETPAEIRLYRLLGADAVGMSTVPEAVAARHQGMRVAGISCITNFGSGMTGDGIHHDDVMEMGSRVSSLFKQLLTRVIARI